MEIKKEKIKELVKILDELNLTELSYSDGKTSLNLRQINNQSNLLVSRAQWLELLI